MFEVDWFITNTPSITIFFFHISTNVSTSEGSVFVWARQSCYKKFDLSHNIYIFCPRLDFKEFCLMIHGQNKDQEQWKIWIKSLKSFNNVPEHDNLYLKILNELHNMIFLYFILFLYLINHIFLPDPCWSVSDMLTVKFPFIWSWITPRTELLLGSNFFAFFSFSKALEFGSNLSGLKIVEDGM